MLLRYLNGNVFQKSQDMPLLARTLIDTPASPENVRIVSEFNGDTLIWDAPSGVDERTIFNYTIEYRFVLRITVIVLRSNLCSCTVNEGHCKAVISKLFYWRAM